MRRLLIALGAALAVTGCGTATDSADRSDTLAEPSAWRTVPAGPLGGRENAVLLWTGTEVLVIGGTGEPLCPPSASCVEPGETFADGAAYDPKARTWRAIAPAPAPVSGPRAVLAAGVAYVPVGFDSGTVLAYDVAGDRWSWLPVPTLGGELVAAGDRPVIYPGSHEHGGRQPALALDPPTRRWRPLPPDPLGAGFDRTMVWTGNALVLFDKELVPNPGADGPSVGRAAVLSDPFGPAAVWRRLPDSEILSTGPWLPDAGRLVNPSRGGADGGEIGNYGRTYPYGGVLDVAAGRWSPLPAADRDPDHEAAGAFGDGAAVYTGHEGYVLDVVRDRWLAVPPLPATLELTGRSVVAAGRDVFVFGGATWRGDKGTLRDTGFIWTPGT